MGQQAKHFESRIIEQRPVSEEILALGGMDEPDYVDVFTVATSSVPERSPEQWARAGLGATGRAGQLLWRGVLGLRLAPSSSPRHVAGWDIAERGDNWLRLEAASWFMTAHVVVHVDDDQVSVATFVRYDKPLAGFIWPRVAGGHRAAMPRLLRHAARRLARRPGNDTSPGHM